MSIVNSLLWGGTLTAVFAIIVIKLLHMVVTRRKWVARFKDLPQSPCNPILGHFLQYPGPNDAGLAFQREKVKEFPRLNLVWFAHIPILNCVHPDTVKIILKSSEPKSYRTYHFMTPWIGDGLLKSNGKKWSRNRRLLTPAFHFDILKGYVKLKNKLCDILLSKFDEAAKSRTSLNVFENISMFTLDVMLQSTMSYETGCQNDGGKHLYIGALNRIIAKIVKRFLQPWLHSDFVYFLTPTGMSFRRDCHLVHQITDEIILKRRKELECSQASGEEMAGEKRKHQDFLDTLIMARDEDGQGLTSREIRDEVDTFLFEGHDTTSSAISWSLYSIAQHPEVQNRIQEEIDGLVKDRDNDYLFWNDMLRLPYLTMVIKESMRLHCPVPFILRQLTKDTVYDNFTVPAGTIVSVNIYNLHHNPTVWEDTMKFDPERFSPEQSDKRDPFAFIPFSAGQRNCIGQNFAMDEMKICLARILHRYSISVDPTHSVTRYTGMVIKAENDIKLSVKARSS